MLRVLLWLAVALVAGLLAAKAYLRSRADEDLDEIDLAVVAGRAYFASRAEPFLGGTVLVVAGTADLDLTAVVPAPTGVELALNLIGARVRILVPSEWNVGVNLDARASQIDLPLPGGATDAPWLRIIGRARLARIQVRRES